MSMENKKIIKRKQIVFMNYNSIKVLLVWPPVQNGPMFICGVVCVQTVFRVFGQLLSIENYTGGFILKLGFNQLSYPTIIEENNWYSSPHGGLNF